MFHLKKKFPVWGPKEELFTLIPSELDDLGNKLSLSQKQGGGRDGGGIVRDSRADALKGDGQAL